MRLIVAFCFADVLWSLGCPLWAIGLAVGLFMEVGREAHSEDHR